MKRNNMASLIFRIQPLMYVAADPRAIGSTLTIVGLIFVLLVLIIVFKT